MHQRKVDVDNQPLSLLSNHVPDIDVRFDLCPSNAAVPGVFHLPDQTESTHSLAEERHRIRARAYLDVAIRAELEAIDRRSAG